MVPSSTRSHTSCTGWEWSAPPRFPARLAPAVWFAPGRTYSWDGDLNLIPAWRGAVLAMQDDVAEKLARAPFAERHAFLVATADGD